MAAETETPEDISGKSSKFPDENKNLSNCPKSPGLSGWFIISRMSCCSCLNDSGSKVKPGTLDPEEPGLDGPENIFSDSRSCTDIAALIVLITIIIGFGVLLVAIGRREDNYQVTFNASDSCPNICGWIKNKKMNPDFKCDGANSRNLLGQFLDRCVPKQVTDRANFIIKKLGLETFFQEVSSDLQIAWRELLYLFLIILGMSLGILVAFRYIVEYIIYVVLSGTVAVSSGGTIYFWLAWHQEKQLVMMGALKEMHSSATSYFIYSIIMTIVAVGIILVVLVMRKRIALVIQLFHEAGKALYSMPALLFQPIYTYILIGLSFIGLLYSTLFIENAGELYTDSKNQVHVKKDTLLISARWYSIFLYFIVVEFYLGCQHMIVAGAVARWFFTRDKKSLNLTVTRSASCLVRYHLGTVAFGTLVISVVRLLRAISAFAQNRLKGYNNQFVRGLLWCCQCWIFLFECALKFVTRNSYIETAIYGCNFCTGGKKAFRAISENILREAVINSVGDFILLLGKIFVVALTVVAGVYFIQKKEGLYHPWVTIFLAAAFAFVIAHSFISIYEMVIDTIFICFCEDCSRNDGINRRYYMSRGLMEFVENSKKVLEHTNA